MTAISWLQLAADRGPRWDFADAGFSHVLGMPGDVGFAFCLVLILPKFRTNYLEEIALSVFSEAQFSSTLQAMPEIANPRDLWRFPFRRPTMLRSALLGIAQCFILCEYFQQSRDLVGMQPQPCNTLLCVQE